MFRLTHYLKQARDTTGLPAPTAHSAPSAQTRRTPSGPVVIWNLIRRCNLTCQHCYSISADHHFPGELSTPEIHRVMDDLKQFGVPVLILSGGEPLLHPEIFAIAARAKGMGFYVGLSSNGTLIDRHNVDAIAATGFDYVGISLDGIGETHDRFRRKPGAFEAALAGLRLCREAGVKVGVRFTLTRDNSTHLPQLLDLIERERIDKFYMSHLNYAGRGNINRGHDALHLTTRWAIDLLIRSALDHIERGLPTEFVTGNNDADAAWLLLWAQQNLPGSVARLRTLLRAWGGNSSGVNIANIDNLGNVHPDTMWWDYTLGNVRERSFSAIWTDVSDPLMAGLKQRPRQVKGRCSACRFFDVCGGNTRTRAWQLSGDPWQEDPGCYLSNEEIGLAAENDRLTLTPYSRRRRTVTEPTG